MKAFLRENLLFLMGCTFALAMIFATAWFHWYRCGIQADVWQREGITVTQWEVFMGAKPMERTINLK